MENLEAPLTIDLNIPPFNGDDYNIKEICQKISKKRRKRKKKLPNKKCNP